MKKWPMFMMMMWLFLSGATHAALPREVSGSWYNPAQSGHGVTVDLASPGVAIVYWMVYDTQGAPMPLYVEGRVQGRRIEGQAYAPRGMRFGSFDPRDLTIAPWGQVTLEFSSCSSATLRWNALDPAYGAGSMPMTRLTAIPAGSCVFDAGFAMPHGGLDGELHLPGVSAWLSGAVAADDTLYATTILDQASVGATVIDRHARIVVGVPSHVSNGTLVYQADVFPNGFLCALKGESCPAPAQSLEITVTRLNNTDVRARAPEDGSVFLAIVRSFIIGPSSPFGRRRFSFDIERALDAAGLIEFGDNESLCVRLNQANTPCLYRGRYSGTDRGAIGFELTRAGSSDSAFRGIIRVDFNEVFIGPHRLHFVGSDGQTGLAFGARTDFGD